MRVWTIIISAAALGATLAIVGCGHKVIATGGEHSVSLYPDEDTYKKLAQMKGQGGVAGMLGGLGENLATNKVDSNTPVKIIYKDDLGAQVEVTDGPSKGAKGFVPKANLD
jgi:precorrin-4 methylase